MSSSMCNISRTNERIRKIIRSSCRKSRMRSRTIGNAINTSNRSMNSGGRIRISCRGCGTMRSRNMIGRRCSGNVKGNCRIGGIGGSDGNGGISSNGINMVSILVSIDAILSLVLVLLLLCVLVLLLLLL